MTILIPILGDQLSHGLASLRGADPGDVVVLMMEVADETTYVRHHKAKIALVLGDAAAPPGEGAFIAREPLAPPPGLEAGDGADPRWRWRVRDPFGPDAYRRFG